MRPAAPVASHGATRSLRALDFFLCGLGLVLAVAAAHERVGLVAGVAGGVTVISQGPLAWSARGLARSLLAGALCGLIALAVEPSMQPWQVPEDGIELLRLSPIGGGLLASLYLAWMLRAPRSIPSQLGWVVTPVLFNGLLALSSTPMMQTAGQALIGPAGPASLAGFVARAALIFGFKEVLLLGIGWLMDRRGNAQWPLHALLLLGSLLIAASPLLASLANQPHLASLPWVLQATLAVLLSAVAQCGLWADTFLITGLVLDALNGRRPTATACHRHWRSGLRRGAIYAALFMTLVLLVDAFCSVDWLTAALGTQPAVGAALLGALAFPLLKTLVESFDGSAAFATRLRSACREPRNALRGAVAGCGVGLAWSAGLPELAAADRFLVGAAIGALSYAGADLLWNLREVLRAQRSCLQSWRVYGLGLLLGGFVGGALAWYLDRAQLAAIIGKFHAYAALDFDQAGRPIAPYVVYPLFSKYGAIDLGLVGGGVKLLYVESLSGVINWSLAAPLFSINLLLLTALFEKSWTPLRGLFSAGGMARLVEQAVRVLRWGLWMAPVIYSFLRLAPDPTWYNQDGALRTIVATLQSVLLSPQDFRAWSLSVFLGLLAYDALRVLIWFDHMGLRVATLVNLSFVGADALDEKLARFLGHSARTRVVPEGIRRFLTWAPLLIPFYIPRGAEWDQVWNQATALAKSDDPILPAVLTLLIAYRVAAAMLAFGVAGLIWRRLRTPAWSTARATSPEPFVLGNGQYAVELHADGRGYSRCESEVRPGFMLDLTRRPDDPLSLRGKFIYLCERDPNGQAIGPAWSLLHEPLRYGAVALTQPSPDRLRIVRSQAGIRIEASVSVSASEPQETWDLQIHNTGARARVLDLTRYQEMAVGPVDAYRRTPAFAGMHVGTVFLRSLGAVLARNRLMRDGTRISHEVGFTAVGGDGELIGFQDARGEFLGLGTARAPEARMEPVEHEGLRYSFDPCAALCVRVELPAGATRRLRFIDGYARDETVAAHRIAAALDRPALDAQALQTLCRTPRPGAPPDDERLRGWADPWSADGRELRAPTDARRPWSHVIANPQGHGLLLSADGALAAFAVNAQQNALSPFCLESLPAQQPGELTLLLDLDSGECFSPSVVPLRRNDAEHDCVFGLGHARFSQRAAGLQLQLEVFVDVDEPAQYRVLRITNTGAVRRRLRLLSVIEMVLAEVGVDSAGRLQAHSSSTERGSDVLLFRNARNDFRRGSAFAASSLDAAHSHSLRSAVIGAERDLAAPYLLLHGKVDARPADDGFRCAAFSAEIDVAPGQTHESVTVIGQAAGRADALRLAARLREPTAARAARDRVTHFWDRTLGVLRVQTADRGFDRLVNHWLPYQLLVSRLWGRAGPAQRSGALGFRDQLQDVLPLLLLDPALARRQILLHAAQQFREGDVLKWWHDSWEARTGIGVRTRASDPHLWLPYVVLRYVAATGDAAILDEPLNFLEGAPVPDGAEGYLLAPRTARDRASLYEHCRRAIDLSLAQRGAQGLPLLGSGDWNDGLDMLGLGMRGQSTWMAFFLHDVLRDFAQLPRSRDDGSAATYLAEAAALRAAAATMWRDGGYVRATSDAGEALLYADALTASWAVLSGSVDLARGIEALERGCATLERERRVLLMTPAFDENTQPYPGRIAEYPPGVRENGGQYSHGSSWLVDAWLRCAELAEAQADATLAARCRQRAYALWIKVSPLSKCDADSLPRYALPPHQQPADVYEGPGYEGRGGWPWYTGAAARMLSAAYALLGLRADGTGAVQRTTGAGNLPASVRIAGRELATADPTAAGTSPSESLQGPFAIIPDMRDSPRGISTEVRSPIHSNQ